MSDQTSDATPTSTSVEAFDRWYDGPQPLRDTVASFIRDGMVGYYRETKMAGWGFYPIADKILEALPNVPRVPREDARAIWLAACKWQRETIASEQVEIWKGTV